MVSWLLLLIWACITDEVWGLGTARSFSWWKGLCASCHNFSFGTFSSFHFNTSISFCFNSVFLYPWLYKYVEQNTSDYIKAAGFKINTRYFFHGYIFSCVSHCPDCIVRQLSFLSTLPTKLRHWTLSFEHQTQYSQVTVSWNLSETPSNSLAVLDDSRPSVLVAATSARLSNKQTRNFTNSEITSSRLKCFRNSWIEKQKKRIRTILSILSFCFWQVIRFPLINNIENASR